MFSLVAPLTLRSLDIPNPYWPNTPRVPVEFDHAGRSNTATSCARP